VNGKEFAVGMRNALMFSSGCSGIDSFRQDAVAVFSINMYGCVGRNNLNVSLIAGFCPR
jgi:hypothetical protein